MIHPTTNRQLHIMLNNTNKALAHVVNAASASELKELSQFKDLKSIMNSILQKASKDSSSNQILLNLVKNNPTLKNLGATTQTINDILARLKAEKDPLPSEKILQKFLVDVKDINEFTLKEKIQNSGLFLESKIKNIQSSQAELHKIKNSDLKAILHTAKEELSKQDQPKTELIKHIDKLALQIDHAQLLSHLSNATSLYLPFSWDAMKEGKITIQKKNDDKFNVDIDLNLKEYGELNLKLSLFEKNQLNLHIYTLNQDLQNLIKENIADLRSNLISQQITPREIRIFHKEQTQATSVYETTNQDLYMGFEVKA